MKLYNSLTRQVDEFTPLNPSIVTLYTCGPTVYDYMHIGNLRTFIFSDLLVRTLNANGYKTKAVQNITDIDDKIIKRANEKGVTIKELSDEYTKYFLEDILKLNILPMDVYPKATDHIGKMIKFIEELIDKGFAYIEKDGSVYFDISKFQDYGKLSQLDKRELKSGTRILSDEYTKDNIQDFALWKSAPNEEASWDSPWGKGRPGWHIECSVMSQEYLGETLDIHAGAVDLIFPHHENEIAQSEAKTGKPFVRFFVHGEHLLVDNKKMSKSLNNFYRLNDLADKSFDPLSYRYLTLSSHYRDKLNFTWESLQAAQNTLDNLRQVARNWDQPKEEAGEYYQKFLDALNNDLNTPQALATLHEMISSDIPSSEKARDLLEMDKILGLKLDEFISKPLIIPGEVQKLLDEREQARSKGDFITSDLLRGKIKDLGFEIEDTPSGPKVKEI